MIMPTPSNKKKSNLSHNRSEFIPAIVELLKKGVSNKEIAMELAAYPEHFNSKGSATSFVGSISSSLRGLKGQSRKKGGFVFLYAQFLLGNKAECPPMAKNKASAWYIDKVYEYLYGTRSNEAKKLNPKNKLGHAINGNLIFDPTEEEHIEGKTKSVFVNRYERDPKARKKCIDYYGIKCQVCNFDFLEFYGEIGSDFIHVHHLKPLSQIGVEYSVNPKKDLIPVCPNCHAMLHKGNLLPAQLKEGIKR